MSDLFISYARLDIDYRLLLVDQLLVVVKTGPIGRISPTADSLSESYRGIRAADYFLFVTVLIQWYPRFLRWKLSLQLSTTSGWLE